MSNFASKHIGMQETEIILQKAGIRPTAIRTLILREIAAIDNTFSLSEMEERLDTVDRSTIFRTLTLFQEHHILHEVDNGSGSKRYCRCVCHTGDTHSSHIHFTCEVCHKTYCIKDIDGAQIPRPENFIITEINCVLKGICPDCRKTEYI